MKISDENSDRILLLSLYCLIIIDVLPHRAIPRAHNKRKRENRMEEKKMEFGIRTEMITEFVEYLYEQESSQATIRKYERDIRAFFNYAGSMPEDENISEGNKDISVGKRILLEYKGWLQENYAVSSVNSMLAALNQFLAYFGMSRLKVKRLKQQKQVFAAEDRDISVQEYKLLVRAAEKKKDVRLMYILETICSTGIRISELSYFTVESVRKGQIAVSNKGKNRVILIPHALRMKLLYYIQKNGIKDGVIFVTKSGNPVDRSNVWLQMKKLTEESGVEAKKIFPHNLRHLFAKTYYQMTKDITGLADILGHSSIEVTRIYTANAASVYETNLNRMNLVS